MTWADATYSYRKKITIDKTKVPADLTDFPVLLLIASDSDLKDVANGGHVQSSSGYDICFYDADDATKLDHELVTYDETTGALEMWIRKPTLDHDANDSIYIYYGKSGVGADPTTTNTWSADYLMVQHMLDYDTSHVHDSTSNARTGTKLAANQPIQTTGNIGDAQEFDGSDDYIGFSTAIIPTGNKYISMWFNTDITSGTRVLISNGDVNSEQLSGYAVFQDTVSLYVRLGNGAGTAGYFMSVLGIAIPNGGGWHFLVVRYDGTTLSGSIDGGAETTSTSKSGTEAAPSNNLLIGDNNTHHFYWDGAIGETHVSNSPKSANWKTTEYNNQSSPGTFYSIAAEEAGGTAYTRTISDSFSISESLVTLKGTGYERSLSESLTISESLSTLTGTGYTRSLSELLTISDNLVRQSSYFRNISDSITISEALSKQCGYNKSLSDSISISESLSKSQGFNINISDSLSILDVFSRQVNYKRIISDIILIKEKLVKTYIPGSTTIYNFFDPRITIRNTITGYFDLFQTGVNKQAIEITYNGSDIQIPIYLTEETKSNNSPLPTMPFIELALSESNAQPVNVLATGRKRVARITATIYYTKSDDIDQVTFGKIISDEICDLIRTYQCHMFAIDFINVNNNGRIIEERLENQVVYKKQMELYVLHYYL